VGRPRGAKPLLCVIARSPSAEGQRGNPGGVGVLFPTTRIASPSARNDRGEARNDKYGGEVDKDTGCREWG